MSDGPDVRPEDALQVAQRALARVSELEERVAELEGETDTTTEAPEYDARDQAIVENLEPGQQITVTELRRLYRRHTDIRSEQTLKERTKALLEQPDFDLVDIGVIQYDPAGGASA